MTGEEALARIRKSLQRSADETPAAKSLIEKIRSGKATYQDTALYARWAATNLGLSLSHVVCDIDLSDRAAVCKALLLDQYEDINGFVDMVQAELDSSFGFHLAPQRAPFAAERADTIGQSLADTTKPDDVIRRRAQSATATATKAIHDDRMKAEARFRSRAGLKCHITRTAVGGCCPWCSDVAGRYEYGEEPDDIYRRHDNCDCTVTFENGRQRQDVWSKRTWEVPGKDAGAAEPTVFTDETSPAGFQPTMLTAKQAASLQSRVLTNGDNRDTMSIEPHVPATADEIRHFTEQMLSLGFQSVTGFESFTERNAVLQEIAEDFTRLHADFAEVFESLHLRFTQTSSLGENAYAEYSSELHSITLNPLYYNALQIMRTAYADDMSGNFHPRGTSYRATTAHEFGHAVADFYHINGKQLAKRVYEDTHRSHFTRKLGDEWITNGLCIYATEYHYEELVAEAFAEYYGSSSPRAISELIVRFIIGERG